MSKDEGCSSSSPATGGSSLPPLDEKREEESLNLWYAEEGASIGWVEPLTYCDHLGSLCSDLVHIPTSESPCSRCDHTAENWLCLSCKDVLCSRFVNRHMLEHYEEKGHCLALSYSDLSVWCFNCEAYLDAAVIQQLRPVYETAYILKFGEAPPITKTLLAVQFPPPRIHTFTWKDGFAEADCFDKDQRIIFVIRIKSDTEESNVFLAVT
ncbi:hypothetical protein V2J09_005299 [Rumex salicifolius]